METLLNSFFWIYAVLLVVTACIDIRTKCIEPRLVFAMLGIAVIKICLEIFLNDLYLTSLWAALITGSITTVVFWSMHRLTHGLGKGDVKLMAVTGLFYSVRGIFTIVFFSMLLVAIAGIIMVIRDRRNLKAELPFAPFVAGAAVIREIIMLMEAL